MDRDFIKKRANMRGMRAKPLVVGSDEAFPIYSQDPVSDVQPSVRSGWSVRDQCADVDPRRI